MPFIPDDMELQEAKIPWFEDAAASLGIRGHNTSKSIDVLKTEVRAAMASLGGGVTGFVLGYHPERPKRYGYRIEFNYGSRKGVFEIAALPIRKETAKRREAALKQALFTIRDVLDAQVRAGPLMPGSAPLIQYMIDDKGRTLAEALAATDGIPLLAPPIKDGGDIIEGDFREDDED